VASVISLDVKLLKEEIAKDDKKIIKLWEIMANRMIILNPQKLYLFKSLTVEKIRLFCKMCKIKLYRSGEQVDLKAGGILFKGTLEYKDSKFLNLKDSLTKTVVKKPSDN